MEIYTYIHIFIHTHIYIYIIYISVIFLLAVIKYHNQYPDIRVYFDLL